MDDPPTLVLGDRPIDWRPWLADVRANREVLVMLARKDFQTRYKRTGLGVLWAVALPVLQSAVMAFIFSRVLRSGGGPGFAAYVMSGILAWSYFAATLSAASTSIVDGSGLTDKVWFPRLILVASPVLANSVGLGAAVAALLVLLPVLGGSYGLHLLWLVPGSALVIALSLALGLVLSALHVYFRDVRYLVQAALLVWLYVTPIVYQKDLLGSSAGLLDLNPMTGVVTFFHMGVLGAAETDWRPIVVSVAMTVALLAVGLAAQRRHDRLFVDNL